MTREANSTIEVKVWRLALDGRTDTPVVILQETAGKRVLPIWIGRSEARAIAMEMAGQKFQRPLTHDLLKTVIEGLEGAVCRVAITELRENTFFAKLFIEKGDEIIGVDARPSDSIALALKTKCPVFVAEELLREPTTEEMSDDERAEALRRYLDEMNPEDFGKFPL
ncbi:MAG: bifunctional nuclease family protein [bacterium]